MRDLSLLKMIEWNCVILDEAQAIKNPAAKRTIAIKQIGRRMSIAVTGTPVENSLTDLWSLTDFSFPKLLGALPAFCDRFRDESDGAVAVEPIVSPILLRRRIRDVAKDLPPRIDIPQPIELEDEAAQEYESLRERAVQGHGGRPSLGALTHLRMYCTHRSLLLPPLEEPVLLSAKYRRLLELIDEISESEEKAIVFTSYTQMIDMLRTDLAQRFSLYTDSIDGRVPVELRQDRVDDFSKQEDSAVLVLNPKAAGTGLNITAANHVIHYNLEWNPAVEDQASARAHRKGQALPVSLLSSSWHSLPLAE